MRQDAKSGVGARMLAALLAASSATAAERPKASPTTAAPASPAPETRAQGMVLHGGQDGTAFRSLTVEGEDRAYFEFDRPELEPDLDPAQAPGLDWGSAQDVLDRTVPDGISPLVAQSAAHPSPYLARPWLQQFVSGAVARFRPEVQNVERWKLVVADSRGQVVASFEGRGQPSGDILWDGRTRSGGSVQPGLTYSYVFEAFDRAGNKRNFVGPGFEVPAYRLQSAEGITLAFSVRSQGGMMQGSAAASAPLLEAASWLNQAPRLDTPVRVTATARSYEQASTLANNVTRALRPHLLGDPSRVETQAAVEPDAPEAGSVRIGRGR